MGPEQHILALLQRTDLQLHLADIYSEDMAAEAECLAPLLQGPRILDIGAGLGGYWAFIQDYRFDVFQLDVLDYNRVESVIKYGFKESNARQAYSLDGNLKKLLERNGAENLLRNTFDAEVGLPPDCQYETIVSLYSWGFHYPFAIYADVAYKHLVPGGRIILDARLKGMSDITNDSRFQILEERPNPAKQNCRLVLGLAQSVVDRIARPI